MPAGMPFSHRTESGDFMEQLQTRRLLIRPFRPEDAPALQEIFGDGPTMEYIEPPYTQEQTTEFLESFCIGRQGAVAAVLPDSGKLIGYLLFKPLEPQVYEIGWIFHRRFWGNGYAFEACKALIRYAFETLCIQRLLAETTDPVRSASLMCKLGMRPEPSPNSDTDDRGHWTVLHTYSLTRSDYFSESERIRRIRCSEAASHTEVYSANTLFESGSWLAHPVKTVQELVPLFTPCTELHILDLGCGVGRNCIPFAQALQDIPCRIDCVDILELAIMKLQENARKYGVADSIHGIVSSIDDYSIPENTYDLILAVSALEHVADEYTFCRKLQQIRDGIRSNGIACLIVNTAVRETDLQTGRPCTPQFEVNLPTRRCRELLQAVFSGWEVIRHTCSEQQYSVPRDGHPGKIETSVLTYAVRRH